MVSKTMRGAPPLHSAWIEDGPRIVFTCRGHQGSRCHMYPDDCEVWDDDSPGRTPHEECWMQPWFDNECTSPCRDSLDVAGYAPGMSGPIVTSFEIDYIEWSFGDA